MAPSKIIVAGLGHRWNLEGQALLFDNLSLHLEAFIRAFGRKMSSQRHQDKSGVLWGDVCELAPEWQRSQFKSVSFLPKASFIVASTGKEVRSYCQKKDPQICLLGQLVSGRKGQRRNCQAIGCNFQILC